MGWPLDRSRRIVSSFEMLNVEVLEDDGSSLLGGAAGEADRLAVRSAALRA